MIRVAFTMIDGAKWRGGWNYLLNLFRILSLNQQVCITPILFVGKDHAAEDVIPFSTIDGVELVQTSLLNKRRRINSLMQSLVIGRDTSMQKLFVLHRVDVVFEAAQFFGWRLGIPAIAWITDFQHLELPKMFSVLARIKRDIGFRAQILGKRFIMLSSEHARRTCEVCYPSTKGYTRTVHFAVPPGQNLIGQEARKIADSYGLPGFYFYMPNQFWRHKNHTRVIKALAILRAQGKPMVVAASGEQDDYRDPEYFGSLKALVKQLGIEKDFQFLGMIPYVHVKALMQASVALLNPSLSEGWSTPVEEAKSLGIPMILSDLEVHKEQAGQKAVYFDRYSALSLSSVMHSFQSRSQEEREQNAGAFEQDAEKRVRDFGVEFTNFVEDCIYKRIKK